MTLALSSALPEAGLPQLSGRLVLVYRTTWFLLAAAAVAVLASSVQQPGHPAVFALRAVKAVVVIAVCGILLRRRANDPVAALLSLAFLTWTITSSFDFATAEVLPQLLDRARFLLFALALLLFPDGKWQPRWTRSVAAASATVFLLGVIETLGLSPTRLFLPVAIGCVLAAIAALILRFRTAVSEAVRQQLKWIALGLVAGVGMILTARGGAALTATTLMPMPILWEILFQLGIVTVALGFMVSLLRYRLFDAEAAISRSASLAGLTLALVATFAGTEATIEWVGQQYFGMGAGDISAAMAAAVAAVLLTPLHNRISEWAEQHFQGDLVSLRKELPELLADLAASASPSQLGQAILPRISEAVHATRSALIAEGRVVAAHGISAEQASGGRSEGFPVRLELHNSKHESALLLGPRPDGSLYGKDDREALGAIVPPIRHALSWALNRERSRRAHRLQASMMRREIALLNDRIAALARQKVPRRR